jgi:hypothetical protein
MWRCCWYDWVGQWRICWKCTCWCCNITIKEITMKHIYTKNMIKIRDIAPFSLLSLNVVGILVAYSWIIEMIWQEMRHTWHYWLWSVSLMYSSIMNIRWKTSKTSWLVDWWIFWKIFRRFCNRGCSKWNKKHV